MGAAYLLVVIRIVSRSVEDRDADLAVLVDVWVVEVAFEPHDWRREWVVFGEGQGRGEETALEW